MGVVRVISDLHFGHYNMAIKRGFKDDFEHDEYIVKMWNSVVKKRDTTWILGDITMEKSKYYYRLDQLNGIKKVVLGNHDRPQHVKELLNYVNSVCAMINYQGFIMTHCPIHERELIGKKNVHGHVHEKSLDDSRYINVSCDVLNYTPILFSELLNK